MGGSRRGYIVVAAALVMGAMLALDDASAARRPKLVVHVNGKVFKANRGVTIALARNPLGSRRPPLGTKITLH